MRKKRVTWSSLELQTVVEFMDSHPELGTIQALRRAQQMFFTEERYMSPTGISEMVRRSDFEAKVERARQGIETRRLKTQEGQLLLEGTTPRKSDSVVDRVLQALEPRLDALSDQIAERVAAILLPQIEERINDMMFSNRVTRMSILREEHVFTQGPAHHPTGPAKRRIDVVGLLSEQTQFVKQCIADWDVKVRFILSEHVSKVDKLAPEVILCSKFISHDATDRAKASGSKIHYANGAASSVVNLLEGLCRG